MTQSTVVRESVAQDSQTKPRVMRSYGLAGSRRAERAGARDRYGVDRHGNGRYARRSTWRYRY